MKYIVNAYFEDTSWTDITVVYSDGSKETIKDPSYERVEQIQNEIVRNMAEVEQLKALVVYW